MKDGFIKIALAAPKIRVADPEYNAAECARLAKEASASGAKIIAFPELTLTGATAGDLFYSSALIEAADGALSSYIEAVDGLDILSFIGLPIKVDSKLYNAVCAVSGDGAVGFSVAVNQTGANEKYFSSSSVLPDDSAFDSDGIRIPFNSEIIYECENMPTLRIFVEIGDDAKCAVSPASIAALAGATLVINPTSLPEYVGLDKVRSARLLADSERLAVTYASVGASIGESGTDGVYSGARAAAECGEMLLESKPFADELLYFVADLGKADALRMKRREFAKASAEYERAYFDLAECESDPVEPKKLPFVPECEAERRNASMKAISLQAHALAERMKRAYAKCAVVGVSGGLDSTLAVLGAVGAADILGLSREAVVAITMPCFGTSKRTKSNALSLARELGCTVKTVDIRAAVERHFKDIGHDKNNYNVVYENSQARERTQVLMDIANAMGGMVIGTGDLSELALGFATYNGDHMSMYAVNASIPKTMMRAIVWDAADEAAARGESKLAKVLYDVVNTPVSPELLPISGEESEQKTESIVGPYELHDFFLYYTVKYGYSKAKILRLAIAAFGKEYSEEDISKYLGIFISRFFSQQFKRSCMPDGPRVSEISLSPRAAWQMPSDASAAVWKK